MCGVAKQIASIAMTAFSTASRVNSLDANSRAQREELRHRMLQEEYNKNAAREQMKVTLAQGEAEAEKQRRKAAREQGERASMLAASGFELDSGSMESLLAEGAEEAAHDNAQIRHNAALEAWRQQAVMDTAGNRQGLLKIQRNALSHKDDKTQSLLGRLNSISRR